MFICLRCHKSPKEWPQDGMLDSFGPCEICKEVTTCLDCHGHPKKES